MHEAQWLPEPQLRAWQYFVEVSQLLQRRIERNLSRGFGLSHAQYEILSRLEGAPDHRVRMTELAERVVTAKSSLTYQIDQLVQRGLVDRVGETGDARAVNAMLTQSGAKLLQEVGPAHLAIVRQYLLDPLTAEQVVMLGDAMQSCWKRLRADRR